MRKTISVLLLLSCTQAIAGPIEFSFTSNKDQDLGSISPWAVISEDQLLFSFRADVPLGPSSPSWITASSANFLLSMASPDAGRITDFVLHDTRWGFSTAPTDISYENLVYEDRQFRDDSTQDEVGNFVDFTRDGNFDSLQGGGANLSFFGALFDDFPGIGRIFRGNTSFTLELGRCDPGCPSGDDRLYFSAPASGAFVSGRLTWREIEEVPEPSILALVFTGMAGMGLTRRRRQFRDKVGTHK